MDKVNPDIMTNKDFAREIESAWPNCMGHAKLDSILVATEEHASGHLHKHAVVVSEEKTQSWLKLAAELRSSKIFTNVRSAAATTRPAERLGAYLLVPTRSKLIVDEQYYANSHNSGPSAHLPPVGGKYARVSPRSSQ